MFSLGNKNYISWSFNILFKIKTSIKFCKLIIINLINKQSNFYYLNTSYSLNTELYFFILIKNCESLW